MNSRLMSASCSGKHEMFDWFSFGSCLSTFN